MRLLVFAFALLSACAARSAEPSAPPSDGRAQVVLVGTFHFDPSGADQHRSRIPFQVRAAERQREIADVVDRLAAWRPTKIGVEWPAERQAALDQRYGRYASATGDALPANEIDQLGIRLAARLDHDRLHAIDARHRWYSDLPDGIVAKRARALGQRDVLARTREWNRWYETTYDRGDELLREQSLAEHLLWLNAPEQLRIDHGRYLVGEIEVGGGGDYTGADVRTAWFNRNLRIYSNILRMQEGAGDRILVVIGAGHVPILQHLVEHSPELELLPLVDVLDAQSDDHSSQSPL
jgi:hypothetical protein